MVWRVIGTLAFIITGAQVLAVRRMLGTPALPWRRGGLSGDEAISRSLLASPSRDGSAMTLWPELVLPTLSTEAGLSAPSSSVTAGRQAAANVSPIDVLDPESLVALTRSRLDVDDLVARHRKIKPADLPGDLPYAVLHCCAAWMQRFTGTRPTAIGSGDFRQQVRGLLMIGCSTGAVAGLAMRDLPVDEPKAADRKELIRSGLRRAAATTSIDTLELLTRSRDLQAVASHVADWARTLADRAGVTIADSESFAAICELAFADGVYLGLTAPSPRRHDF